MSSSSAAGALPRRAREMRKARHWTQQQVADMAGVSLRTYQLFETEQSSPQPANLRAITDVLGLEPIAEGDQPQWEPDVQAFLNMIGVYMEGLGDKERERFMLNETRRIFQQMRAVPSGEREEAEGLVRDALERRAAQAEENLPSREKGKDTA